MLGIRCTAALRRSHPMRNARRCIEGDGRAGAYARPVRLASSTSRRSEMAQEESARSGNSSCDCTRPVWQEGDRCRVCREFTCKHLRVYLGEGFVCWNCDTPDCFACPDCDKKGCSDDFSTCEKCDRVGCDACIQKDESGTYPRWLCPGCRAKSALKCGDCRDLRFCRNWGAIHVDCEECDRAICKACISLVFAGSKKKWLCPKCAAWRRENPC